MAVTASDNFNRTASELGNATTGQTWVDYVDDWAVANPYATCPSVIAMAALECNKADGKTTVLFNAAARDFNGSAFRVVDPNNYLATYNNGSSSVLLRKTVAGTTTTMASTSVSVPAQHVVEFVGDSVKVYGDAGALLITYVLTSTEMSTFGAATKHGIYGYGAQIDNFTFDDLIYGPTVSAGPDVSGYTNETLNLDGTVTGTGTITYEWTQVGGAGELAFGTPTAVDTTVISSQDGTFTARLTATDDNGSASDDATVTVTVPPIIPPTAAAGPDVLISETNPDGILDGSGSTAGEYPIGSYVWSSDGSLDFGTPNEAITTVTSTIHGEHIATLTVYDNSGGGTQTSDDDTAVVTYLAQPLVFAGEDVQGALNQPIQLNATISYPSST